MSSVTFICISRWLPPYYKFLHFDCKYLENRRWYWKTVNGILSYFIRSYVWEQHVFWVNFPFNSPLPLQYMGFCQWFRYFRDRIKLLKLNSVYYYSSNTVPNHKKMVFIRRFDDKRYQWYEFEDSRSFWTKVVSIEGKSSKIRSCTKWWWSSDQYITSEKEKCCVWKKLLVSAPFLLFSKAMPTPLVNSFF